MEEYYLSLKELVVVCVYSLLWFVVGIRTGQRLPSLLTRPGKKKGNNRKGRGGRRNEGKARNDSGRRRNTGNIELYVGNLSYDMTDKDVRKEFKAFGKVTSVRLIKNNFNGKSKGYGFVEMIDRNDAEMAIRKMNNKEIMGRKIIVNEAKTDARG